jgi:hypothetical protein
MKSQPEKIVGLRRRIVAGLLLKIAIFSGCDFISP